MKTIFYIGIFIMSINAQSHKQQINEIKKEYYSLKKNEHNLDYERLDDSGETSEGGQLKYFFDENNNVRILKGKYFGSMGNAHIEFYFKKEALFFVYRKEENYNAPIFTIIMDSAELAQEWPNMEKLDSKKSTFEKNRYYFYNDSLIRWLDNNKKEVPQNSENYLETQTKLLKSANENMIIVKSKLKQEKH